MAMTIKFASLLAACLLLAVQWPLQLSTSAQVKQGEPVKKQGPRGAVPAAAKVETSGGTKTETKATRRRKGRAVTTRAGLNAQAKEGITPDDSIRAEQGGAAAPGVGRVGEAKTALNYDIGIIPGVNGCPPNSEEITVHMDDEDNKNANYSFGWIGMIVQDRNTTFKFCRVDSWGFHSVSNAPYAVLQLDICPTGATSIERYFDNEDHDNQNSSSTSGGWGISPNNVSVGPPSYTRLKFCLFPALPSGSGMPAFPDLGVEYGVFAPPNLPINYGIGQLHIDDEDEDNENGYDNNYYSMIGEASTIISGSYNTDIKIVKVRP